MVNAFSTFQQILKKIVKKNLYNINKIMLNVKKNYVVIFP